MNWKYIITTKGSPVRPTGIITAISAEAAEAIVRSHSSGVSWDRSKIQVVPTIEEPTGLSGLPVAPTGRAARPRTQMSLPATPNGLGRGSEWEEK